MKKFLAPFIFAAILIIPTLSYAFDFRGGEEPFLQSSEQISGDLYIAGSSVTSEGSVAGDLIAGGGNIVIKGNVGQDVTVGGGNVNIFSSVGDDVRVGGGNINISGNIGGDLIAGGGQISLSGPGIAGDAAIGGGDVRIDSPINGNLMVGAHNVYINAPISGDIKIEADVVKLGSNAVISGNMVYESERELIKDPGATVNGKITFEQRRGRTAAPAVVATIISAILVWKFFALLVSALLVGLIFRRYGREVVMLAEKRPLMEIIRGLVFIAAVPVILMLISITIIGIPIGILGLFAFIILMIFSWIMAPIVLGSFTYRFFSKGDLEISWKTILLGTVIFVLLGLVPFVGWLVKALVLLLTLGCVISMKWRLLKEWR